MPGLGAVVDEGPVLAGIGDGPQADLLLPGPNTGRGQPAAGGIKAKPTHPTSWDLPRRREKQPAGVNIKKVDLAAPAPRRQTVPRRVEVDGRAADAVRPENARQAQVRVRRSEGVEADQTAVPVGHGQGPAVRAPGAHPGAAPGECERD